MNTKKNISLRQTLHFFSNNNSGLRRTVWESIPFPEVDFGEDQTWAKKVIEAGKTIKYEKESIVYHSHNFKISDLIKRNCIELNFFERKFDYKLNYSVNTIYRNFFKKIYIDIKWLHQKEKINFAEINFSIINNLARFIVFSKVLKND